MARKEASILPFMVLRLDQDQMFQSVVVILLREEAEIGNHCISGLIMFAALMSLFLNSEICLSNVTKISPTAFKLVCSYVVRFP